MNSTSGWATSSARSMFANAIAATTLLQSQAIDRRERLRRLALETIDLAKDPYFMRNHLGQVNRLQ